MAGSAAAQPAGSGHDSLEEIRKHPHPCQSASGVLFFILHRFLDGHITELIGVEDLSAVQALHEFNVLFARYHANLWMFAGCIHCRVCLTVRK